MDNTLVLPVLRKYSALPKYTASVISPKDSSLIEQKCTKLLNEDYKGKNNYHYTQNNNKKH